MNHPVRSLVVGVGAVAFVLATTPTLADEEKRTEKRETETEVEHESPPRVLEKRERIEVPAPSTKEHTVLKKKEKREVEEEEEDDD